MYITKVLKRKDAASVIVAIVIGLQLSQVLPYLTARLAGLLSGLEDGEYISYSFPGTSWRGSYLQPIISLLMQLIILEVLIRLVVWIRPMLVRKAK